MTTILVIEDRAPLRTNILELLSEADFDAVGFERGFTGMMWGLNNIPDVIICDIMMPDLDGYNILSELNRHPSMATVGFIFLTAKANRDSITEGMELGADVYLTKPFRPKQLLEEIASCLAKQTSLQQALKVHE